MLPAQRDSPSPGRVQERPVLLAHWQVQAHQGHLPDKLRRPGRSLHEQVRAGPRLQATLHFAERMNSTRSLLPDKSSPLRVCELLHDMAKRSTTALLESNKGPVEFSAARSSSTGPSHPLRW